jgi:glycerol-3-phosphate dehydrogenase
VAALNEEELKAVGKLYENGVRNKVIGIELAGRERMLALEPNLNPDVVGGLHAPSGGVIEPYRFVFALIENAQDNAVELATGFQLAGVDRAHGAFRGGTFRLRAADGRVVRARYAVNAAGLYADRVSALFGAEAFRIAPRKGEEFLLDRNARGLPGKVIYPVPTPVSKGILVIPTVEGTCMVGPTAVEIEDKQDLATSRANLEIVFASARRLVPALSERDIITSFAGLRPTLEGGDFLIESSGKVPALVQAAGLQSPGLTASPAVAEYVKDLLKKAGLALEEKPDWNPCLPEVPRMRELTPSQVDELTRRDPAYGEVVCRCEGVSEAEIVAAVRRGHRTLDGIKFYTRAQMGRCQGGFCTYRILRILARETGLPVEAISKRGPGSEVLGGVL